MNRVDYQNLGLRIKKARENIGISQSELSRLMDLSRTICGQWERGTSHPSINHLLTLSKILKVSFGYLITGKEENKEQNNILNDKQHILLDKQIQTMIQKLNIKQKQALCDFLINTKL